MAISAILPGRSKDRKPRNEPISGQVVFMGENSARSHDPEVDDRRENVPAQKKVRNHSYRSRLEFPDSTDV